MEYFLQFITKIPDVIISHIFRPLSREESFNFYRRRNSACWRFPGKQLRLVLAWIDIHKDELMADRELAVSGEEPFRITPLQ